MEFDNVEIDTSAWFPKGLQYVNVQYVHVSYVLMWLNIYIYIVIQLEL